MLRAARHAGEDTAAVGASLRTQKCLRSRVRLGEDLTLKLPGDGLGGGGLPPAEGGASVVQSVSRRWGIASGCRSASHEGPAKGRGSSAHTNLDHLYTQAFLTYCAMHSGSSAHTRFLSSGSSVHTLLAGWGGGGGGLVSTPAQVGWWGGGGNGKHTRSSAPAQRCFHACGRVARRGGGWVGRRGNGKHMPAT